MPHHIQDGDNVGSQPGHVTPDRSKWKFMYQK